MLETPYFTVVIPTYNRAEFITDTIKSVIAQTDPDFEIVVVDDGSTDNTEQVVQMIDDSRLTFYRKENGERAAARNYGADRARGQYINFLDSDDVLYSNHLSAGRRLIEKFQNPEIFHLGFEMRDGAGKLLDRIDSFTGELNEKLLSGNRLSCNGVFLRRDVALRFRFNEDRRLSASEDWELWLRLAARFPIQYSNEVTSVIVNHETRSVLQSREQALRDRMELTLKYLSEDEEFLRKYGSRLHLIESEFLSYIALHLALAGEGKRARGYLKESVLKRPGSVFQRRFLAVVKHIIRNH